MNLPSHMIGALSAELRPVTWQARFLATCRKRSCAWEQARLEASYYVSLLHTTGSITTECHRHEVYEAIHGTKPEARS